MAGVRCKEVNSGREKLPGSGRKGTLSVGREKGERERRVESVALCLDSYKKKTPLTTDWRAGGTEWHRFLQTVSAAQTLRLGKCTTLTRSKL